VADAAGVSSKEQNIMKDLKNIVLLMQEGKLELAKDLLADHLQTDPQNREALFNLGMCYCELNNPEKAVQALSECVKHHPGDSNAHVALGYAQSLLAQNGPARENFLKALRIDPENAYALQNLGNLYGKEEDYEKAVECLEKAFAANQEDQQAAYTLGYACFKAGRFDMAEKYLVAAVDLNRSTQIAESAIELIRDIADGRL